MRQYLTADVAAFRAQRDEVMHASDDELVPIVDEALQDYANGNLDWYDPAVDAAAVLWWETFEYEQGRAPTPTELAEFQSACVDVLERTGRPTTPPDPVQVNVIAGWLSAYALNSATAAGGGRLEWVTRQDMDVRAEHVPLDGDQIAGGATFDVAGYRLHFPGEPVGPPHVWINCRCVVRQVKEEEMDTNTTANLAAGHTFYVPPGPTGITPPFTTTTANANVVFAPDPRGTGAHPAEDDIVVDQVDDDPGENDSGDDYDAEGDYTELDFDVPWHGVIAPTGVMSGDRRKFNQDALRTRDLPLPVKFMLADDEGHKGSVPVANMTYVEERDGLIHAGGFFHVSPAADEAIALVATQTMRGLSVDLDDATFELQYEDGSPFDMEDVEHQPVGVVTDGRISSVTLCAIPAFQEAYIVLGAEDESSLTAGCIPCQAQEMDALLEEWDAFGISEKAWDGSASRFTPEQWYRSCTLHKSDDVQNKSDHGFPILEPDGNLSRAGVHAAAARINQAKASPEEVAKAKRSIITAYHKLDEDPPEALTATAFASPPGTHDGPGWVTNPKETQRLRTYWTRGKGAAKIRWGQPGDFNRCRRQLAKYVPNPEYLAGTCANLHKVAMGLWPGQEGGKKGRHSSDETLIAAAFTLVDDVVDAPPATWFTNPNLEQLTPLTVEGRHIYGHLAGWATCHTGFGVSVGDGEVCVQPPTSASGYAYFHTGQIITDDGAVNVGHITMDTGHAGMALAGRPAAAHYDNTGSVVADIVCGEDKHGIWFSGALRPDLPDSARIAIGAAALSGDWRRLAGNYELIAALAVNVPGFPIPRTAVSASAAAGYALVAAGLVVHEDAPTLAESIRAEIALIKAEEARAIVRAQIRGRVHHMQAERARARLAQLK